MLESLDMLCATNRVPSVYYGLIGVKGSNTILLYTKETCCGPLITSEALSSTANAPLSQLLKAYRPSFTIATSSLSDMSKRLGVLVSDHPKFCVAEGARRDRPEQAGRQAVHFLREPC